MKCSAPNAGPFPGSANPSTTDVPTLRLPRPVLRLVAKPAAGELPAAAAQTTVPGSVRDPRPRHHGLTRFLHWTTAVLLIGAMASVLARDYLDDRSTKALLLSIHQSTGLTLLALTAVRLLWRAYARVGRVHATMGRRQRVAALAGHYLLYFSMLTLTILGWSTANAFGMPLRFLGLLPVPALIARNRDLGDDLQLWHADAAWLLLALVLGHAAAAFWHHYVRRNDVLRSMGPS